MNAKAKISTRLAAMLAAVFFLTACGTSVAPRSKKSSDVTVAGPSVTGFDPATSSVVAPPTTVTVSFSESALTEITATALSSYIINCGGNYIAADAVTRTPGTFTAVVTLPALVGLASGTTCTFIVSTNIKNASGSNLIGSNTANYTVQ